MKRIDFTSKQCRAQGRNGMMQCLGLLINHYPLHGMITISPINSKDIEGNCFIDIPIKDLPAIIEALQSFLSSKTQANTLDCVKRDREWADSM
jgi:hypothetical protein